MKWSKKESNLLARNYYKFSREELEKLFPDRTWKAIEGKASDLGLHKERENLWTEQEKNKLIDCINMGYFPSKIYCSGIFKKKTFYSIKGQYNVLKYSLKKEDIIESIDSKGIATAQTY